MLFVLHPFPLPLLLLRLPLQVCFFPDLPLLPVLLVPVLLLLVLLPLVLELLLLPLHLFDELLLVLRLLLLLALLLAFGVAFSLRGRPGQAGGLLLLYLLGGGFQNGVVLFCLPDRVLLEDLVVRLLEFVQDLQESRVSAVLRLLDQVFYFDSLVPQLGDFVVV